MKNQINQLPKRHGLRRSFQKFLLVTGIWAVAIIFLVGDVTYRYSGMDGYGVTSRALKMTAKAIEVCLTEYAKDHEGHYPDGKSSTEVFQRLIDEKYVTDPGIFYLHYMRMPGKVAPSTDQLKPENVCWDVTCCVDSSTPNGLPVVFLTGYRVTYLAGSRAMSIHPPPPRNWVGWLSEMYGFKNRFFLFAVAYRDCSTASMLEDDDGTIPNFIPADFDPKGKTYRQLTP